MPRQLHYEHAASGNARSNPKVERVGFPADSRLLANRFHGTSSLGVGVHLFSVQ
jgi:hypothetical protein